MLSIKVNKDDTSNDYTKKYNVSVVENDPNTRYENIKNHNFFDLVGTGKTKDDAVEDLLDQIYYLIKEWSAFALMLEYTNVVEEEE